MRLRASNFSWSFFLFGFGSQLQLFGSSLSFTELFVVIAGPVILLRELPYMKKTGAHKFFGMAVLTVVGCVVSCLFNQTPFSHALRGLATTVILAFSIAVGHWLLRRDMNGYKWLFLGIALSGVVSTFYFQKSVEINQLAHGAIGKDAVEAIMEGPIYWIGRIRPFLMAIPNGWYLQCPWALCVMLPIGFSLFAMLTTVSGRSAALTSLAAVVLMLWGGKRRATMRRIGKYFWVIVTVGILGLFVAKNIYSIAAKNDLLGEKARLKYEAQTQGDSGMLRLLLGGRMESFCGLIACIDRPLVGFGPWAVDEKGYVSEFISKYGTYEDVEQQIKSETELRHRGVYARMIPCHAYITEFWLWYGLAGLLFWLYVIYVFSRFLRQDCWVIPQWYLWIACGIPGFLWGVFFSPLGERAVTMLFVTTCFIARGVRLGKIQMPPSMIGEIIQCERRGK